MKEYKIMLKSIKKGEWITPLGLYNKGIFRDVSRANEYAEDYLRRDKEREYPNYSGYKIMIRDVSEWEDVQ